MTDWKDAKAKWLADGRPKTASTEGDAQREEFVRRFPWQRIPDMTLYDYALGTDNENAFSRWLEHKTQKLGRLGGDSLKHGVFRRKDGVWRYPKQFGDENSAFESIRTGLYELARAAAEERYDDLDKIGETYLGHKHGLRFKPLYLWFPDRFVPITSYEHLAYYLSLLGLPVPASVSKRNRALTQFVQDELAAEGWDTRGFVNFLYNALPPPKEPKFGERFAEDDEDEEEVVDPTPLLARLRHDKNVVLTGPPGTGKTWLTQRTMAVINDASPTAPKSNKVQAEPVGLSRWYDILAWGLYKLGEPTSVDDLLAESSVYEALTRTGKKILRTTAWGILQAHTHAASDTVNVADRRSPSLFDKSEDSLWYLTVEGREYVQQSIAPTEQGDEVEPNDEARVEFVTFHPSFGYEEFVEGIRPAMDDEAEGTLRYEVRPGPFLRLALAARAAWEADRENPPDFLLVVDEINRADVARTFGDLLALLEPSKRLGEENALEATLPYSGRRLGLPPNLLLLATMNTSDRSVALMDLALRRRFAFVECAPDPGLLKVVADVDLPRLLATLNESIAALLGPELALGHAFLMDLPDADALDAAWNGRVLPQLVELFHGRTKELEALLGPAFFESRSLPARLQGRLDEPTSRLRTLRGESLLQALRAIYTEAETPS